MVHKCTFMGSRLGQRLREQFCSGWYSAHILRKRRKREVFAAHAQGQQVEQFCSMYKIPSSCGGSGSRPLQVKILNPRAILLNILEFEKLNLNYKQVFNKELYFELDTHKDFKEFLLNKPRWFKKLED